MTMKMNEFVIKVHCASLANEDSLEQLRVEYAKMYLFYAGSEDDEIAKTDVEMTRLAKETYLKLKTYFETQEGTTENA